MLAKLYLLELRYSEAFQALARQTKTERNAFVDAWEDCARIIARQKPTELISGSWGPR